MANKRFSVGQVVVIADGEFTGCLGRVIEDDDSTYDLEEDGDMGGMIDYFFIYAVKLMETRKIHWFYEEDLQRYVEEEHIFE